MSDLAVTEVDVVEFRHALGAFGKERPGSHGVVRFAPGLEPAFLSWARLAEGLVFWGRRVNDEGFVEYEWKRL